jgi:hypothetical protein
MIASTLLRKFGVCVSLIAALTLATYAAGASAEATPVWFSPPPETFVIPDVSPCTGLSGTTTITVTDVFHIVSGLDTAHVELTETLDYRSDWSDGTYLLSHSVSHNEFNTSPTGEAEFSFTQQDRGTLYSADGQVIGHQAVIGSGHVTWDNGTPITSPKQFHVTCF